MATITINGKSIEFAPDQTVLQAAIQAGIEIPTLCYHKDLSPFGGCRLCIVDVKGARLPMTSCTLPATDGMEVTTESEGLTDSRRTILELLLSAYYDSNPTLDDGHPNELIKWAKHYKVDIAKVSAKQPRYPVDSDPNPFVHVDMNKCILCGRCIRACAEVQGRFVWGLSDRGYDTKVVAGLDEPMLDARCESCGACVAYCPTGALDNKLSHGMGVADKVVSSICPYCGVGCTVDLNVKDGSIIRVTSSPDTGVNGMHLCVKGRFGYQFIHHPERLTKPMVREYLLQGKSRPNKKDRGNWVEVDWDTALKLSAKKLGDTRDQFGPDSVGVLSSAKCLNEENYLMNKFARQVIGTNNVDHCARLCHSSTVVGLAASFGSGAMTNTVDDITAHTKAIMVIGSNTTEQHPVFGTRIRQAVLKRNVQLIVADPRKIDLTEFATLHLQMKSGTDIALVNGLMYIILEKGYEDREFVETRTENYEEFKANVLQYTPQITSEITGIPVEQLYQAAEILGKNKPGAIFWAMGITQHIVGVQNVKTCGNLQMLLGNIGVPGGGVNPLRGQNNVQGACDMGALPNVYPAYQAVVNDEIRDKFEKAWGTPLSPKVGMTVTEMIPAAADGKIKALYILGENPIMTDPDTNHIRHCLEELDFMILQEIFPSETSVYADILLPGVTYAEKSGTYTNTERRVQLSRKAIEPVGDSKPDWWITSQIANLVLANSSRKVDATAPHAGWNYQSAEDVMTEVNALAPSYAGAKYDRLEKGERLHWPIKAVDHPGTPILHIGQFTRGKGLFAVTQHIPPAEMPDAEYPFLLNTGRVLYHWHGGTMTRRSKGLMDVYGTSLIEVNPEDAQRLGINGNKRVRVTSRRGTLEAQAWVTDRVPPGMIYGNFHFPEVPVNELTIAALDPIAKIPEYKVCAVQVTLAK